MFRVSQKNNLQIYTNLTNKQVLLIVKASRTLPKTNNIGKFQAIYKEIGSVSISLLVINDIISSRRVFIFFSLPYLLLKFVTN